MSTIRSFFDKYLPFDRKRKLSEDKQHEFAPKRKLPRLSQLSVVRGGPAEGEAVTEYHYQPQQQRVIQPPPPLNPLPKSRGFFGQTFTFRKPNVTSRHSSRYGMDSIELDSDDDVELVEFLKSRDVSPGTFRKLSGRQNAARPLPALIPRHKTLANGQPQDGQCRENGNGGQSSSSCPSPSMNPYVMFKKRFNISSPQIRAPGGNSRSHQMVNSALRKSFALQEKQKYSDMCSGLAPPSNSSSSSAAQQHRASDNSLFGALQRASFLNRSPFATKNPINIGSRNRYGKLLEKFSSNLDTRLGGSKTTGFRRNVPKPSTCVDLTRNGVGAVELTDDEEDDDEDDDDDVQEVVDLVGGNGGSFKIPKSFPCAAAASPLDNQQHYNPRRSIQRSPQAILKALENVDQDVDEEEDEDQDICIVLDYDDDQAGASTSSSQGSRQGRHRRRQAEAVVPVNTLLDELQARPVFKDDWLEATRRRYTEKQDLWALKIAEEDRRQAELEQEDRHNVHEMIKKMDEALLLREVIVVEDEEEAQRLLAKAQEQQDTPLPQFTADQMNRIRYAAGRGPPDEVLITKFNLNITRRDIATLLGDSWLNDEVINFYMNLLMERSEGEGYPRVHAMNTFFMPKVLQQGQAGVRRWTRKVDIFGYDVIPVPVHVSNIHWCMAIVHLRDKYIRYYDSMGQPNRKVLDALEQYLRDESLDKRKVAFSTEGWVKESVADCPRQMNGSDCGVFSCMFAEYVSRGHRINFTQENMPYFRQKMILEICTGKLLL